MHCDSTGYSNSDRGDLACWLPLIDTPHAASARHASPDHAKLGDGVDCGLLKAANVRDHVEWLGQGNDGVGDELPRPVPRNCATAVHFNNGGSIDGSILWLGAFAGSEYLGVFKEQDR